MWKLIKEKIHKGVLKIGMGSDEKYEEERGERRESLIF